MFEHCIYVFIIASPSMFILMGLHCNKRGVLLRNGENQVIGAVGTPVLSSNNLGVVIHVFSFLILKTCFFSYM